MSRRWNKKNRLYRDIFLFVILVLVFLIVSSFTLSGQTWTSEADVQGSAYHVDVEKTLVGQGITSFSLSFP